MSSKPLPLCDCTVRCGDDDRLADGAVLACNAMRARLRAYAEAEAARHLLAQLGHATVLAALQELEQLRAQRGA
jgi:hypothetical protein